MIPDNMTVLKRIVLAALASLALTAPATAHPHVWVTIKSELVYAPDGTVTGVRHAWTFDDMFSTFATQGLVQKTKGKFTREELAPLAEVNVTSLKEYDYFTYATADGKKTTFVDPKDYWLDYGNSTLTLNFVLPLAAPVKAQALNLEIYDSSYFIEFAFAKDEPVSLKGAPAGCKLTIARPQEMSFAQGKKLSEEAFNDPAVTNNWGANFANKISVKCP
jgi:ABC-type uncharacterized transport system substrate-binding protein